MLKIITTVQIRKLKGAVLPLAAPLLLIMSLSETNASAENIYSFVDARGLSHFSNAPTDPRYKKLAVAGRPVAPRIFLSSTGVHKAITRHSEQYGVDPALVRAVIKAESSFNAGAVSRKGAIGLMQLMPRTARSFNLSDPYDPQQNISGGVRHLRYLLDRFRGNIPLALAAYNAGETRVSRGGRIPQIVETREYVRRVLRYYKEYRQKDDAALRLADSRYGPSYLRYVSY
jgi:soluble lytic murein transglycosylase-like protein